MATKRFVSYSAVSWLGKQPFFSIKFYLPNFEAIAIIVKQFNRHKDLSGCLLSYPPCGFFLTFLVDFTGIK
jgi:hypothetical protein